MATLYIEKPGIELEADRGSLILRKSGQLIQRVPYTLLERVVIVADTAVRASVIRGLTAAGIGVFWPASRTGSHAMSWPAERAAGMRRLGQAKIYWDEVARARYAGLLIRGKLLAQLQLLRGLDAKRPDRRFELGKARTQLSSAIGRLRRERLPVESILGVEGAASAAYFEAIGTTLAPALGFRGRNRRPPRDPVNASLSLGYTLLYGAALEAVLVAGLEPAIGFLHEPASGRAALACDLMEPFRPVVDGEILRLFHCRQLRGEHFSINQGACLMGKTARRDFYGVFEERMQEIRKRLRVTCGAFCRSLQAVKEREETRGGREGEE